MVYHNEELKRIIENQLTLKPAKLGNLARTLGVSYTMIACALTSMNNVYEEDNGTLKVLEHGF